MSPYEHPSHGYLARDLVSSAESPDVWVVSAEAPRGVIAAMASEGLVRPVRDDVYLAADRWRVPEGRAAALGALLGPPLAATAVVGGRASAWWHLVIDDCPVVDALVPPRSAGGSSARAGAVHVRGIEVPDVDVIDAGPVRVCTLARAVADVARWASRAGSGSGDGEDNESAARDFVHLVLSAGCSAGDVTAVLDSSPRSRGTGFARRLVAACVDQMPSTG